MSGMAKMTGIGDGNRSEVIFYDANGPVKISPKEMKKAKERIAKAEAERGK